jgi:glycosyltransferase involved in cell wall biosynthesis
MSVAIVHDYLTQRGGAERVVLSMAAAFRGAPIYTSLYEPNGTFPEFADVGVRTLSLNHLALLRRNHRMALPLLSQAFSRLEVSAEAVVCSSSGWSHGTQVDGRKIVYCHTPARWLYQPEHYLGDRRPIARLALDLLTPRLCEWDRAAARSADLYLCNSTVVQGRIRRAYGIEADLLPPPHSIDTTAARQEVEGLEPGFVLCVSRLLPYKNVDAIVAAFAGLPGERLVVVGSGPEWVRLAALAGANVRLVGSISDEELRWLYANCAAVVAASREDYGLTPLEGAAFGKPSAVLRWGGFLDTVVDRKTGVFFDAPRPSLIRDALQELFDASWDDDAIRAQADRHSEQEFIERLRRIVLGKPSRIEDPVLV